MSSGITYCLAFPEDEIFGAVINSFLFRWTTSYIVNPEYEPEDILIAVMHAFLHSECAKTLFLIVLILPVWGDTPWNSAAIKAHGNMSTLIQIPVGHMRLVLAHKQSDEATYDLPPTNCRRSSFSSPAIRAERHSSTANGSIRTILAPAIQTTYRLKPEQTHFSRHHPP
jgi:hypothetical protein